jgi:hypothetical protein
MAYLMGRLGEQSIRDLVTHPANGVSGIDAVSARHGLTFEDIFGDWLIANYLDNRVLSPSAVTARYLYPDHVVGPVSIDARHNAFPVQRQSTVHQYAADYIELGGHGNLLVEFSGDTTVRLVPTNAHSGRYAWWSNRGDDSDVMLTRAFDLRYVDRATLRVSMWYDIETDWDYAYIEVSVDGGETWEVLDGQFTTLTNPHGNSFGAAYTGRSDGWIEEVVDLGAYAGRQILVRFEYITDDAVTGAGWLIDDVRIPELGYVDDLESGPEGWIAEGFVYSDNRVSQRYLVQLVSLADDIHVYRVPVDETGYGRIELRGLGDQVDSAVLVISALAPATTEVAAYEYRIQSIE